MCIYIYTYVYIVHIYIYNINTHCIRMFSTTFPRIHPGPAFQWLLPLFVTEEPGISLGKNLFPQIWSKNLALKFFGPPCFSPTFKFIIFFLLKAQKKQTSTPRILGGLDWKVGFFWRSTCIYVYTYICKWSPSRKSRKINTYIIQTEQGWHLQCGVLAQALVDLRAPAKKSVLEWIMKVHRGFL